MSLIEHVFVLGLSLSHGKEAYVRGSANGSSKVYAGTLEEGGECIKFQNFEKIEFFLHVFLMPP